MWTRATSHGAGRKSGVRPMQGMLAPEHTAREVFDWLLPLYEDLADHVPDGELIVMGDSAGGNPALSQVVQAAANGAPRPAGSVLLPPCLDASLSDPAITALDRIDPIVSAHGVAELARMYAGPLDTHDPVVSPLFAALNGLPPIALITGTHEIATFVANVGVR
ncbi:alpha/beta hydrolase fold domain-containing protein [Nocardia vinacea]|uniref:alpha/beta hydrolase fold domain-containing protein n=1 Tax=Nocardia vinacea TaxID=96468 RepID=UPI0033EBE58E